jgi:hypothetical protein
VVLAGGFCAVVLEAAAVWSVAGALLGAAAVALWSAGAAVVAGAALAAVAFWSVVLGVDAGGFTGALALSAAEPAGLLVVAAGAFALFVSVVGVWLLPAATGALLLAVVEVALWSEEGEAGAAVLLAEAVESAAAAPAAGAALEAWLLVQESEIMFTELTWTEPSLARGPWIATWCPSWGFSIELSPCRLTLCPLSAASTQFPPDCFRQPFKEEDWSLVLVADEFVWSVVEGEVDGVVVDGWLGCWSGVEPELPVCANAIPVVSISAKINFLFMSLLLRSLSVPVGA